MSEPHKRVRTSADAADPQLRGRTYAIPFEQVWQAALALAGGGLRGWSHVSADDDAGEIQASAQSSLGGHHTVRIHVFLDADAQTRVDAEAASAKPGTDFGRTARRLRAFFTALDRAVQRAPVRTPR